MKLGATLYIRNTVEAVDVYREAFGLSLGYHEKFEDGTFLHASLERNGQEIFAVCECTNDPFVRMMLASNLKNARPTMSYGLNFDTADDVRKAFGVLSKDGTVMLPLGKLPWSECCGEVVDRYGVYWYLTV
jgi:PhnB protein